MKRTEFHKQLLNLIVNHDCDGGIAGLCKCAGIKYQTMQNRLRNPREMRIYEFDGIAESLHLNNEEQSNLMTAIRNG